MSPSRAELAELFDRLSDEELQRRVGAGVLTALAREVAAEELARRALAVPAPVEEEPVPAPAGGSRFVLLERFLEPMDAQALRARLEAEGIPALVNNANYMQAVWLLAPVLGGVRLEVPESYTLQARAVADAFKSGQLALAPGEGEGGAEAEAPSNGLFAPDRRRLRELAAAGMVLAYAALVLAVTLMRVAARSDWPEDAGTWLPLTLPAVFMIAALMLAARSKWSLALFGVYLLASFAVLILFSDTALARGTGLGALALTGLILYYGIYQLGQGRLE